MKKVDPDYPKELHGQRFRRMLKHSQDLSESKGRSARKTTLEFDESVKVQRQYIYNERNAILANESGRFDIFDICQQALDDFLDDCGETLDRMMLERFVLDTISYDFIRLPKELDVNDKSAVRDYLTSLVKQNLDKKKKEAGEHLLKFYQLAVLKAIDEAWVEEVDYLQQLRLLVESRQTAQRNTVNEYHKEAMISYKKMKKDIRYHALQNIMLSQVVYDLDGKVNIVFV